MDCSEVQEEILDSFEGAESAGSRLRLEAHLAGCPTCAGFAAGQKALHERLTQLFTAPEITPAFRPALRRRISTEKARRWSEALPDIVHFASCGATTVLCAFFLPYAPSVVFSAGITASLVTYLPLSMIRNLFADS